MEEKITGVKEGDELSIRMLDDSKVDDSNYGGDRGTDTHVDITCDSND